MIELGLILGLAIGVAIGYLLLKSSVLKNNLPKDEIEKRYVLKELYTESSGRLAKKEQELAEATKTIRELDIQLASLKKEEEGLNEKLALFKEEIETLHTRSQEQFKNLANEILEEKSKKFTDMNKEKMESIIKPWGDQVLEFQNKVKEESKERNILAGQITALMALNKEISKEANNLASALKGDSKAQGNWGEIILEKVLERSGLEKDNNYKVQYSLQDEEGSRQQPDVVVFLPGEKHIIIDSKVSLTAYESFVNAENEEARSESLLRHIVSVKKHIDELSKKNYQALKGLDTPDFVLLFMPIESSFSTAARADNELFNYAWNKKIVIVSPSTLLATLYTISSLWKQEKQTKNVLDIATESGKLYDKFQGLINDLVDVGRKMASAKGSYEDAMNKLSSGPGNIVKRIEHIRTLGAKATKVLPPELLNRAQEE